MINWKKLITVSLVLLTGCAPPETPDAALISHEPPQASKTLKTRTAKQISSWTINGAIAAKNKTEAWTASINWKQNGPNNYQIRLFGPLGGGSMLIEKKGGVVTYQDAQKRTKSYNADELMYQQTGIRIPIKNLYYWIRGLPAPGTVQSAQYEQYNQTKRLSYLKQDGYAVKYLNYTNNEDISLPSKIYVQSSKGNLKIIIKRWKTH
ncbi:MAG: lipoprotein insertase outer membrane protein LolB [Legionellaceae bacterium]|nr:lipoprotein insertase outer membrane protein LolB [Legionellaceae bacterium]